MMGIDFMTTGAEDPKSNKKKRNHAIMREYRPLLERMQQIHYSNFEDEGGTLEDTSASYNELDAVE